MYPKRISFGEAGVNGKIILKRILQKNMREWNGFIWLIIGTSDGLF
jgi:hypothetical protein